MNANEAPEKIWVHELSAKELNVPLKEYHIEYTRTDAFIKKACEWLEKNADKYIWYSDYAECPGDDTCGMNADFIEDFKNYMK